MNINEKYIPNLILTAIYQNKTDYHTPEQYCTDYSYEDTRSITLKELKKVLDDIFDIKDGE